jgi:hypothetical protein
MASLWVISLLLRLVDLPAQPSSSHFCTPSRSPRRSRHPPLPLDMANPQIPTQLLTRVQGPQPPPTPAPSSRNWPLPQQAPPLSQSTQWVEPGRRWAGTEAGAFTERQRAKGGRREEKKEKLGVGWGRGGRGPSNDKAQGWAPAAILSQAAGYHRVLRPRRGRGGGGGEKSSESRAGREAPAAAVAAEPDRGAGTAAAAELTDARGGFERLLRCGAA